MNWFEAYLDEMDIVTILFSKETPSLNNHEFYLHDGVQRYSLTVIKKEELVTETKFTCKSPVDIEIGKFNLVSDLFGNQTELLIGSVIRTKKFDQLYYYSGNDLGANYSLTETTFKVWAPSAEDASLLFYNKRGTIYQMFSLAREEKGVWSITLHGNYDGYFYRYNVCVNKVWREAVDPYAKAVSVNGEYGVVVDLSKTTVPKYSQYLPPFKSPTDAIIYETHIRDFSIHPESGVKNKGKYVAFCEEGTKGPYECKTCLDYLVDLGITHVELLPFNDFEGIDESGNQDQYNWGYNPVHYNVPEGSYATDPYDPYVRIRETKEMIEALHQKGIRVIMDVVYNHVYRREYSSFRKIVPGYYFRFNEFGLPSDGTGVGNDIASERLMVKKFIIDSVQYWVKEYNVDGFRFDLMGILDIETMNAVRQTIDEIDPSIIMLGEGWNLDTPLPEEEKAIIKNAEKLPRIAHFNDVFRNSVKGSIFDLLEQGFISGDIRYNDNFRMLFAGSITITKEMDGLFQSPQQSVNYVECHDNHTLWDKLEISNADESLEIRRKRQYLAIAIVLLSQGIPFLHSGMEFFRTKYGESNSYNKPDNINQLDWARKNMYENYIPLFQALIAIRKAHPAFRLSTSEEIQRHYKWLAPSPNLIGFLLHDLDEIDTWENIIVLFNNGVLPKEYLLDDCDQWIIAVSGDKADLNGIAQITKKVMIEPLSTLILFKTKI
ncbi:type I pullulanase [Schinkia azotoformans]|uniref:type I pullulanase n=1 Tax=Schinkia azotoformans TaxID=1454 RepID=UPI002DBB5E8C|nr:type I pullulanase [Schinkia azotoformans]MEC1741098.1 type I pullulanase [Schinkia azotoformans]MEC1747256.1 type I pullulanase [Schinkia azotoformans]MEC1759937.1 type I pullulanase [Schinkia azotoformans]MEC1768015.1 type I pullulanase [Schinkia azotoformans]MEC1786749.1 type I pullulanase [Schinkia azotoformans]